MDSGSCAYRWRIDTWGIDTSQRTKPGRVVYKRGSIMDIKRRLNPFWFWFHWSQPVLSHNKAIGNTSKSTDECICNPVPVRDSYSEGGERKCLRVGRCFDFVGSAGNKVDRPVQWMELTDSSFIDNPSIGNNNFYIRLLFIDKKTKGDRQYLEITWEWMKRACAFKRQCLQEVRHCCASRTPSRSGSRVDLTPTPATFWLGCARRAWRG